jgi:two-component system, cell cycle sensor histidine kinase and response regulator CckA
MNPSESRGRETILLVEDEPDIRELVAEVLKDRGYTVLEAQDGEDTLRVVGDLVTRLLVQHPHLNVLYMSGYTDDALGAHGFLEARAALLSKPFTPPQLVSRVRQVLDGPVIDESLSVP